jgi:hypothetical protein
MRLSGILLDKMGLSTPWSGWPGVGCTSLSQFGNHQKCPGQPSNLPPRQLDTHQIPLHLLVPLHVLFYFSWTTFEPKPGTPSKSWPTVDSLLLIGVGFTKDFPGFRHHPWQIHRLLLASREDGCSKTLGRKYQWNLTIGTWK